MKTKIEIVSIPVAEFEIRMRESFAAAQKLVLEDHKKQIESIEARLYMLKEWLNLEEAAAMLNGVKPDTVRKIYTKQGLRYSKVGQNLFFHIDDIKSFIESGRTKKDR